MGSRHRTAEEIAHVQVVQVNDRLMGAPFEGLDSQGADIRRIGELLLMEYGALLEAYRRSLDGLGSGFLVLGRVTLAPRWRGRGIGALLGGLALDHLARGHEFAVVDPAPLRKPEPARRREGTGGGREDARACSAGICAALLPAGPRSTVAAMSWPPADKETRCLP